MLDGSGNWTPKTLKELLVIQASCPTGYNPLIHRVTKFKQFNKEHFITLDDDQLYTLKHPEYTSDVKFTEHQLLTLPNYTIIEFIDLHKQTPPTLNSTLEKELREKIINEISYTLQCALENCASLGNTALRPGPGEMTTTYVERMKTMVLNQIQKS